MKTDEKLLEIVKNYLEEDMEFSLEMKLKDELGLDSLDLMDIVMDIEEFFKIEFKEEDIVSLVTVKDLIEMIEVRSAS